ncbi:MAG: Mor transcription activator family protein [Desulfobacter sp.]
MNENQLDVFDLTHMSADQVLERLSPEVRENPRAWPALLAELVDVLADYLDGLPLFDSDASMEMAQNLIVVIAHHLGGRSFYLPKDEKIKRGIRDAALYKAFTGDNHLELAHKTGLSTAQIYNIIYEQRELRRGR